MSWHREEQAYLFPLPSRFPVYRRVVCACGCGCFFYAARTKGRPPAYVNREHANRARRARRALAQMDGFHSQETVAP